MPVKQVFSFILPVTALIIIPGAFLLIWPLYMDITMPELRIMLYAVGGLFAGAGLFLLVMTIRLFIRRGKGTLAPWTPTQKLVVEGPYSFVRNPMITGVLSVIIGEALIIQSYSLLIWAVLFFGINHLYFILSEEPGLVKRFGEEYVRYKKEVPRWIPKFEPSKQYNKKA